MSTSTSLRLYSRRLSPGNSSLALEDGQTGQDLMESRVMLIAEHGATMKVVHVHMDADVAGVEADLVEWGLSVPATDKRSSERIKLKVIVLLCCGK